MRSNIFTAIVILAAACGPSMVTGSPIDRNHDLSRYSSRRDDWVSFMTSEFAKRMPANGGDGTSGNTGNVNGGNIAHSGTTISNGAGANTADNGGNTASGNAQGGRGSNGGRGGNAASGSSGSARGGSVANNGGSITNTGTAQNPSNKAGNGGFSGTGDARGGDAGSAKRALESEPVGPELLPPSIPSAPAVPSVPSASIPSAPAATSVLSVLSESGPPAPSAPPTPPVPFVNTVLPPKPQATSSPVGIIHNSPATGLVPEQMNNTSQTNSEEDEPSQSGNVSDSA